VNIVRRGSTYNYGKRAVSFEDACYSCGPNGAVAIEAKGVKDFTGKSHHDYTVTLETEDVLKILGALADGALKNPALLEQALSPALKALVQLQYVAAGLASLPNQALNATGHKAGPRVS